MMLTVFTPTYNRESCLERLYRSLLEQEYQDFEWLVVDDGSTDSTMQMVRRFADEKKIPIRYFYKPNGGKHTAYNWGLAEARGDWFMCVDADDYLHSEAVTRIAKTVARLGTSDGIAAYKQDTEGRRLSAEFPSNIERCKISDLALKFMCSGEFSFVFPTVLAQKFPFPVFQGEKFVGESVIYDRIEQSCHVFLLPEIITICEYQTDGYSKNFGKLMGVNPNGFCLYFLQRIDLQPSWRARMVCAGKYWCFRWIAGNPAIRYDGKYRMEAFLGWPLGLLFRIYYKMIRGF